MSAIWDVYGYGRENPFHNEPMQKAYYHPSPSRKTEGMARQTSVFPSNEHQQLTAEEECTDYFLNCSSNYYISRVGELGLRPDGDSVSLDESWPQSERPTTISISEVENLTPPSVIPLSRNSNNVEKNLKVGNRLDFGEEDKMKKQQRTNSEGSGKITRKESTLSKYIERFRNSQPMSREQRLQMKATDPEDFWWIRSPSSRMSAADSEHSKLHDRFPDLQGKQENSRLHDNELLNEQTRLLQEKTGDFLEKMSSIGSSHPAVSTIGLGSDSSSIAIVEEDPYRPAFIRSREPVVRVMPRLSCPEDDILYRWRVQRKRELAKDRVMQFRTEPAYNILSSQKDAAIQTLSGVSDEPSVSHIPIACPHVTPSGTISFVKPHCHLSCDILTKAAMESYRDSRHNATRFGNDDGSSQVASHTAQDFANGGKRNDRSLSHVFNVDRDLSDENVPKREVVNKGIDFVQQRIDHKKLTLEKLPEKNSKSSQPPKVSRNMVASRHELSDTEIWQTTDNEDQEARRCSSEADADHIDHGQKRHVMGIVVSDRGLQDSVSAAFADENKRHVIHQKAKTDRERRRLPTPKGQSSSTPIRSTIGQVINDQLLATSGSHVSSAENFELSSLDLTATELEEPVHDISVLECDLHRSGPPVDLELICSDGEEFADDDILCNLRQRRLFCLQRLIELDQLVLESKIA